MATATNVTGGSTLSNALSLAQLLTGSGKTSSTTTAGKTLSQDAINALIKKQLESTQGLASITGGEKAAGLYNSTVNTQLVNDLMSRTAGEAAIASTPTVTTQTGSGTGGMGMGTGLASLGIMALTDKTTRDAAKKGISSLADVLSGIGSSGAMPEVSNTILDTVQNVPLSGLADYFGETASAVDAASEAGSMLSGISDWFSGWFK